MNAHQRRKQRRDSYDFNFDLERMKKAVESPTSLPIPHGLTSKEIVDYICNYDGPWFNKDGKEVINVDGVWTEKDKV